MTAPAPSSAGRRARRPAARFAAAAALCLAGALALGSAPAATATTASAGDDPLARYHHQRLVWKSCRLGPDDTTGKELGERRIAYPGYSYGSYLGQVYATMFPDRTGRVVLDGVIDPGRYSPRMLRGTVEANRRALADWAAWAAAHHAAYGLGRTRSAVLATVEAVRSAGARRPLRLGGHRVDGHTLPVVVFNGLSQDNAGAYGDLAQAGRTRGAPPTAGPSPRRPGSPTRWTSCSPGTTPGTAAPRRRSCAVMRPPRAIRRPTGAIFAGPGRATGCSRPSPRTSIPARSGNRRANTPPRSAAMCQPCS